MKKGFTLIELLIVLAIIGTLTSFLMVNFLGARSRARDGQRKSDLQQIRVALEQYRADQSAYPPAPLPSCGSSLTYNGVTYMQKIPCDPTNTGQYIYNYTTSGSVYRLITCLENGNDQQKDAVNNPTYCAGNSSNWSYSLTNP